MFISGEDIADVVCAVEEIPSVRRVHITPSLTPSAFRFVVAVSPFDVGALAEVHLAIVEATGARELEGRIQYVDDEAALSTRARPVDLDEGERAAARTRIGDRKTMAELTPMFDRQAIEAAFRAVDGRPSMLTVSFGPAPKLDAHSSSTRRSRVLVVDDDPITAMRIAELHDVEVIEVQDGWSAIDRLKEGDVDLAVCAVKIGEFSGAKIHKLVATANPKMARRIVYLASEAALSQAPPSSASGRLLGRPISPEAVRSMLEALGPVA